MTAVTKTPKRKGGGSLKPLTFKQLLGRVTKHESFPRLLKAATTTGWLTDESFLTRLTDKEAEAVREVYKKSPHAKRATPADVLKSLPDTVGPMVDEEKVSGAAARLTSGERTVAVDARLFLTMKRRHPDALCYLSASGTEVVFSEKTTVAVLPVQK